MTENALGLIRMEAEWALRGKTLGRAGNRVLACSTGTLSVDNFTELLGRFDLGTPDELPQVSVSYLTSGTLPGRVFYLGMAIHKWAADVQVDGGELLERDDDGRPVAATAYFCVPYEPSAEAAVSYRDMYQEFNRLRLGTVSGPRLQVGFPAARSGLPDIDDLAMQAASRLFTGRPVCVLGAQSTTVAERLAFIEAVTQLLPYGFRTRLAAATWVRPTHRDHKFRLFFSATRRDAKPPDDVIYWGRPGETPLTPDDNYAYAYYEWLSDTVGQLKILAQLTKPRSFNQEDIFESMADDLGIQPGRQEPADPVAAPQAPKPRRLRHSSLDVEQVLRDCAIAMRTSNVPDLNTAITRLKGRAKSGISQPDRDRCREIIREEHLFRHDEAFKGLEPKLREVLFKVAFPGPLTYQDYCLVEDSCSGDVSSSANVPDGGLLSMIVHAGMADLRIRAVVFGQLSAETTRRLRDAWYMSAQVTAVELINTAASGWYRPVHALYVSLIAADVTKRLHCEPAYLRKVLHTRSYLARLLDTVGQGHENTQVHILRRFLMAAYPAPLGEDDIRQILTGNEEPPSLALLVAVLLRLTPEDTRLAQLAREAYVFSTTKAMNLRPDTHNALMPLLPFASGWPGEPVAGCHSYTDTDQR